MDSNQVDSTVLLTIETVKLYSVVGVEAKLLHKGPLHVLFLSAYNSFIIQVEDFNYSLSKEIPILAKVTKSKSSYPRYFLPNLEGNYIIKVSKIVSPEALSSFETLLSNHSDLRYEEEEEQASDNDEKRAMAGKEATDIETIKESVKNYYDGKGTKTEVASALISKSGKLAKIGLIKSAGLLSMGIRGLSGWFMKMPERQDEAQVDEKIVRNFRIANNTSYYICKLTETQVENIINFGKLIATEVAKRANETEAARKFESFKHKETVVDLGKSTLSAVGDIYDGVLDALTIVGRELGHSTTEVVTHTCGENIGEVTKQGIDTVGNIAATATVIQKEAIKVIKGLAEKEEN